MYCEYFGLTEAPFSIAPDPRYLYMSRRHREALAHLVYGVQSPGGFVLLTGDVGAGKTTVCRALLARMPTACDVAFIFNPKLTVGELLSTICDELRIPQPGGPASVKRYVDCINAQLLEAHASGRRTVLIIDEAQSLSPVVLEQIRLLTNLETNRRKLLQVILLGQPELRDLLERPELRQLAQRIIARYHLGPLDKREVRAYVAHRLAIAGAGCDLFAAAALDDLFHLSGGVPRLINILCDRALLGAFVQGRQRVDRRTLAHAALEVFGTEAPWWRRLARRAPAMALGAIGAAAAVAAALHVYEPRWLPFLTMRSELNREVAAAVREPVSRAEAPAPRADYPLSRDEAPPQVVTHAAMPGATDAALRTLAEETPVTDGLLRQGSRGPRVEWLSRQLARVQGRAPEAVARSVFDEDLRRDVLRFQASRGLPPDGVVGPLTLAELAAVADAEAPRLVDAAAGR